MFKFNKENKPSTFSFEDFKKCVGVKEFPKENFELLQRCVVLNLYSQILEQIVKDGIKHFLSKNDHINAYAGVESLGIMSGLHAKLSIILQFLAIDNHSQHTFDMLEGMVDDMDKNFNMLTNQMPKELVNKVKNQKRQLTIEALEWLGFNAEEIAKCPL